MSKVFSQFIPASLIFVVLKSIGNELAFSFNNVEDKNGNRAFLILCLNSRNPKTATGFPPKHFMLYTWTDERNTSTFITWSIGDDANG